MDLITPQYQPDVPSEVLLQILSYLDVQSINACLRVNITFFQVIEERLWKIVFFRDFSHFLYQMPLGEQDLIMPQKESQIQMMRKQSFDPLEFHSEPFQEQLSVSKEQILEEAAIQLRNWKGLYVLCFMNIDLNGYWIGDYGRHGKEIIEIYQKGYEVIAKKITGDENVPAGEIIWKMTLDKNFKKGKGFMQVAEIGYKNPAWVTAYLDIIDCNSLQITWFIYDNFGNWYSLTFGTIRAGVNDYNGKVMERKVQMLTFGETSM